MTKSRLFIVLIWMVLASPSFAMPFFKGKYSLESRGYCKFIAKQDHCFVLEEFCREGYKPFIGRWENETRYACRCACFDVDEASEWKDKAQSQWEEFLLYIGEIDKTKRDAMAAAKVEAANELARQRQQAQADGKSYAARIQLGQEQWGIADKCFGIGEGICYVRSEKLKKSVYVPTYIDKTPWYHECKRRGLNLSLCEWQPIHDAVTFSCESQGFRLATADEVRLFWTNGIQAAKLFKKGSNPNRFQLKHSLDGFGTTFWRTSTPAPGGTFEAVALDLSEESNDAPFSMNLAPNQAEGRDANGESFRVTFLCAKDE